MNPLLTRLASLRRKVRFLDGWLGVCALLSLIFGVSVTVGLLDYWMQLPSLVRALGLIGLLVGSGILAYQMLYRPFFRSCDDLSLALRVEEAFPELNDSLATTVQFLKQSKDEQTRLGGSESMRQRTVQDTLAKAGQCDFGKIIDHRAAIFFGVVALCVLATTVTLVVCIPLYAGIAFMRFVEPFGPHTWTRISVAREYPEEEDPWQALPSTEEVLDRIAVNRTYKIKVDLSGKIPPTAMIEIVTGKIRTEKPIKIDEDRHFATFQQTLEMTQKPQNFKFRVVANDGSFPAHRSSWHEVEVLPPPMLVDLNGQKSPQITLYPPSYTDLPSPQNLPPGTPHIEPFAGTNVVFRAKANRPLEKAWIEYKPENSTLLPISALAALGQTNPLAALGQTVGGQAVWGRVDAKLEKDQMTFQINFMPWVTGRYVLRLRDKDRLEAREEYNVNVQTDPVPDVKLIEPGSGPNSIVTALPGASIPFKFRVMDETFAIRSVFIEYRSKAHDDSWIGQPKTIPIYDARNYGQLMPYLLAETGQPMGLSRDPRLRYKRMEFSTVWKLPDEFEEGKLYAVQICADDFCDIYSRREAGRSHSIILRILSKEQIRADIRPKLAKIHEQLQEVEKIQEAARDVTQDIKQKDKIDQPVNDKFVTGDLTQREVQKIIGKEPDQGLRRDLEEIRKILQDNKMTDIEPFKVTDKIQKTLEGLTGKELQQIESKMSELRNDLAPTNEKNTKETKQKLEETANLQDQVLKKLQGLNQELAPSRAMTKINTKIHEITQAQQEIQQDLQALKDTQNNRPKEDKEALKQWAKEDANTINNNVQKQLDLAQQTENLIAEMKKQKANLEKAGNKEDAKKIDDALAKLEPKMDRENPMPQEPIPGQMKNVAKQLQKDRKEVKNQPLDKQNEIIKGLEQASNALEDQKPNQPQAKDNNNPDPEDKNRKEIKKNLDDVANQLDKAQQQDKNIQQEAKKLQEEQKKQLALDKKDPEQQKKLDEAQERLNKKREEIAKQLDGVEKQLDAAKKQLQNLDDRDAAEDLKNQADKLEQQAKQLQKENQEQQAQNQPPQAQQPQPPPQAQEPPPPDEMKKGEEQLSREMIVLIADQLKGLKERQDGALERSEKLQKKILKLLSWRDSYLDTLEGAIDSQNALAEDTDSLKDKLKDAKVFSSILERARESMEKASETMTTRRAEGKDRCFIDKKEKRRLDGKEVEDENGWHNSTVKYQKQASQRLDRLLDAIKQELAKNDNKEPEKAPKEEPKQNAKKDDQPKARPGDGIPDMAQLKVLKAEQVDLLQRTEEFAKQHPNANVLNDEQLRELHELQKEQENLQSLFQDLIAQQQQQQLQQQPMQKEQKEGEPK